MYQANVIIQWDDGYYEEYRGLGPCWRQAKDEAISQANRKAIALLRGFRVLSDKEWRMLPKPLPKRAS